MNVGFVPRDKGHLLKAREYDPEWVYPHCSRQRINYSMRFMEEQEKKKWRYRGWAGAVPKWKQEGFASAWDSIVDEKRRLSCQAWYAKKCEEYKMRGILTKGRQKALFALAIAKGKMRLSRFQCLHHIHKYRLKKYFAWVNEQERQKLLHENGRSSRVLEIG